MNLSRHQIGRWMFGAVGTHAALDRPPHKPIAQCNCYWGQMWRKVVLWRMKYWPESL